MMIWKPAISITIASLVIACGIWLHASLVSHRLAQRDALQHQAEELERRLQERHVPFCVKYLQKELVQHDDLVPANPDVSDLLKQVAHDLSDLRAKDRSLQSSPHRRIGSLVAIPIRLTFNSSFAAAHELLRRLDSNPRLVSIGRLSISRGAEAPTDELFVSLDLNAFAHAGKEPPP